MRFYYYSFFGVLLILLVYALGGALLGALWFALRRWKRAWVLMLPLFALLLILPWAEELWIAWNFGQLCKKDAGTSILKTVEVDGFYDETHGWRADALRQSGYRWMEGRGEESYWRHDRVGDEVRSVRIAQPTARFQFTRDSGTKVFYKVSRQTSSVMDRVTGELLGRYTRYNREAPWFFIGLDRPRMSCDGSDGPPAKNSFLIYRDVLKPRERDQGSIQ